MTENHPEMRRDMLLRRALIAKGYRPTKFTDIQKMLTMIDDEPLSEEKKQRMLRKINEQEPLFCDRSPAPVATTELTEQEQELVTLYRAQNKPLPPDLAAKLRAMEQRASGKSASDEGPKNV